jgi:hypothetical protein
VWSKAPLAKCSDSGLVENRVPNALKKFASLDSAITADMESKHAATGEMLLTSFERILRSLGVKRGFFFERPASWRNTVK